MEIRQTHMVQLLEHRFWIQVSEKELADAGFYQLTSKPTQLQLLIILKRVAENQKTKEVQG